MRLTRYTDYALRVLTYLGAQPDRVCSIAEIARAYGISQNHLMKVAHDLGKAGYVEGVRGRGGIRLGKPPDRSTSAKWSATPRKASTWSSAAPAPSPRRAN